MDNEKKAREGQKVWGFKQYIMMAFLVFTTVCCCILFFFMIYRYHGFTDFWKRLTQILQPITFGLVLAYLLNPVMNFIERYVTKFLAHRIKSDIKRKKAARALSIVGALLFLILIIVLLLAAVVPAVSQSIQRVVARLPEEINNLSEWIEEITNGNKEAASMVERAMDQITKALENMFDMDVISKVQKYISSITSGVIYGVKFLLNIVVGLIVSVYVMSSKEVFAGQAKKIVYAVLKPERANVVVETVRKSHEIFGGFISGKILDSAIIGILAYIVLAIMRMPDTILVSVIVGVTNVIPFFGPFIGAIPSFVIIVLQDPVKGLYFLIFIFILQQIDGNIIGPKILGDSTGLSSFWVIFAIIVFGGLWGFLGMLFGVPIMAVIYYIADRGVSYFLRKKGLSEKTEEYVYLTRVDKDTNQPVYETESLQKAKTSEEEKHNDEIR